MHVPPELSPQVLQEPLSPQEQEPQLQVLPTAELRERDRPWSVHGGEQFASIFGRERESPTSVPDVQQTPRCDFNELDANTRLLRPRNPSQETIKSCGDLELGLSADDACYICLDSDGPMLVNVCSCRNARVHRHCLLTLIRRTTARDHEAHATPPPPRCSVCRDEIKGLDISRDEEAVATIADPEAVALRREERRRAAFCVGTGVFHVAVGMALFIWSLSLHADGRSDHYSLLVALCGLLLTVYALYNTRREVENAPKP